MDDDSLVKSDTVFIKVKASANAALAALAISPAGLTPEFSPDSVAYKASVDNSTAAITLTPSAAYAGSKLMMNGSAIESGKPVGPINLNVGSNVINIIVTAEDGLTTKVYTLSVLRAPSSNADLASLTVSVGLLVPAFAPGTAAYSVTVANASDSIRVTPTAAGAGAILKVNGATVASGTASGGIALAEGANSIVIEATAQDGTTKKTYTVGVTRPPSPNAALAKLTVTGGFLSPAFAASATNYSVSVANASDSIKITPTAAATAATIKVNGDTVASATASKPIALNVGANTIRIEVTDPDGINKNTYTIIVTRASSTNALFSDLVPSAGRLTPALSASVTTYFDSVPYETQSLRLTPTVAAGATVSVDGLTTASGKASLPIDLGLGTTYVPVTVTAQDGLTQKRYTLVVVHLKSSNTDLSVLTVSPGTLTPALAAGTASYSDTVPYATSSISIAAWVAASTSTIKVNGTARLGSGPVALTLTGNPQAIPIEVTAQDGTQKTYTLTVIKAAPSTNAKLSALAISTDYTLSPAFDPTVTDYHATSSKPYAYFYFQPTTADANATMTLDGSPLAPGKQSNLPFRNGYSRHSLVVTAQDGIAKQTYNFDVWNPGADDFITGYAWVDDYSASHALTIYMFNNGSTVNFTRNATGKYTVTFPSLGLIGRSEGLVHVTAYGGPAYCKVVGSANAGDDLVANIACFGTDGSVVDSKLLLTAQFPRSSATGRNAYALADSASTDSYSPDPFRSNSTAGLGAIRISRSAAGSYRVTLKGMDAGTNENGNAMVTAYGAGNTRCQLQGWQLAAGDAQVDVVCLDPATGNRKDSPFNISYMQAVSGSTFGVGAALVSGAAPDIDGPYAFNTGGGAIQSEELATGRYRLFFAGLGNQGGSRSGTVLVNTSAAAAPNTTCSVESWVPADYVVTVDCWDNTGAAAAGTFSLLGLR
jgi:hypothetical protein